MKGKISSDLTKIFQIALIVKFISLSVIILITLFFFDFTTNLIIVLFWILGLLFLRLIGITKLNRVVQNENSLTIGKLNSSFVIPFSSIKGVKRTFLFDDFPYKVIYIESKKIKKLYFLPKSKFFQGVFSENQIIEELRAEIKKSNAMND